MSLLLEVGVKVRNNLCRLPRAMSVYSKQVSTAAAVAGRCGSVHNDCE